MLGIQLSSFPTFLYLIINMLVMKAFRIMHLRGRWNSVMQQIQSHVWQRSAARED